MIYGAFFLGAGEAFMAEVQLIDDAGPSAILPFDECENFFSTNGEAYACFERSTHSPKVSAGCVG